MIVYANCSSSNIFVILKIESSNSQIELLIMIPNLLAWILFGVIAGVIAKLIVPGRQGGGFFATAALGITGAFIGGILHDLITTRTFDIVANKSFNFGSMALAVGGAIIAVFLWGILTGRTDHD
jgi:uncharacterized membrane protein YeaQ/YmgE (transglycosylase-associated protein family)